jgi:hypothetical protein
MIETPCEVVDGGCAINCLLDPLDIRDISCDDGDGFSKLFACLLFVAYEYAHGLLAFYKFGHQSVAQETICACYYSGHAWLLAPAILAPGMTNAIEAVPDAKV